LWWTIIERLHLTFLLVSLAFSFKGVDTMARPKARVPLQLLLAVLLLGGQEHCRTAQAQSNVEHFPLSFDIIICTLCNVTGFNNISFRCGKLFDIIVRLATIFRLK
jgi:hypothetical protein